MRKNFYHLVEEHPQYRAIFGDDFKKHGLNSMYDLEFLYLEVLYTFHQQIFNLSSFLENDPIAIFYGNRHLVYSNVSYREDLMNRAITLLKGVVTPKEVMGILPFYWELSPAFRLFKKGDDGFVYNNQPDYVPDRKEMYEKLLKDDHYIEKYFDARLILGVEQADSFVSVPGSQPVAVTEVMRMIDLDQSHEFALTKLIELRAKEKKPYTDLNSYRANRSTYEKMGGSYPKRFDNISLFPIKDRIVKEESLDFTFHKINHILAPTGAGKTTFIHGSSYPLIHEGKKKIVIFTNRTQQTIEEKNKLEALGYIVAPIIGRSNKQQHQDDFIHNVSSGIDDPIRLFSERIDDLSSLSSHCLLRSKMEIPEEQPNPCESLLKDDKRYICPLYHRCTAHHQYWKMVDADIWIGTPEAFVLASAPYVWDCYERSFFELAILWADLIVIDEVDNMQMRLDSIYIDDIGLVVDDPKGINTNDYFLDYLFSIVHTVVKSISHGFVAEYKSRIQECQRLLDYFYTNLVTFRNLIEPLLRTFTPNKLLWDWCERYTEHPKSSANILFKWMDDGEKREELVEELIRISRRFRNREEAQQQKVMLIEKQLNHWIREGVLVFKKRRHAELRAKSFEVILTIFQIHSLTIYLRNNYDYFVAHARIQHSITLRKDFLNFQRDHDLYKPNAFTESFFAYRLIRHKENQYSLHMQEYKGIGRNLMVSMPSLLVGVEPHEPASLILLSATSDIPFSSYFGVDVPPNWLLENKVQNTQKIGISLMPIRHYSNEGYLEFSGSKTPKQAFEAGTGVLVRSGILRELHGELDQLLKQEQKTAKEKMLSTQDPVERDLLMKILKSILLEEIPCIALVTKSYKKVEWVVRTLLDNGSPVSDVKALYTSEKKYDGEYMERQPYHISINEFENLYKYKPKYVVIPRDAVARALNVLAGKHSARSFIRTFIFFERPHPVPGQFADAIMNIHGSQHIFLESIRKKGLTHYSAVNYIRTRSYAQLNELFTIRQAYSLLNEKARLKLAANELVPTIQMMGRGMRNGTSVHVIFLDAKMAPKTFEQNHSELVDESKDSIIIAWKDILTTYGDELVQRVHQPFIQALNQIEIRYINSKESYL